MIPGIGTIVNGVGVLFVGILSRIIFKKEVRNFEENLLPLGLLVLALGFRAVSYTHLTLPTKA